MSYYWSATLKNYKTTHFFGWKLSYLYFLNRKKLAEASEGTYTNFYSYAKNFGEVRKSLIGMNMSHRGTVFSI